MLPKKEPLLWSSGSGFWKGRHLLKDKFVGSLHSSTVQNRGVWGLFFSSPVSVVSIEMQVNRKCWCRVSGEHFSGFCKVPCSIPTHTSVTARVVGNRRRDREKEGEHQM